MRSNSPNPSIPNSTASSSLATPRRPRTASKPDERGTTPRAQGWGVFFYAFTEPDKVNVVNLSKGGRPTRTFLTEGLWDKAVAQFKAGDVVLIQLGQNDVFALNDQIARGTIPGIGDESEEIDNIATPQAPRPFTPSAGSLRKFIRDTKATGAWPHRDVSYDA